MNIKTSYFAALNRIPDTYMPIAISRFTPKGTYLQRFIELAPPVWLLNKAKAGISNEQYRSLFFEHVLSKLSKEKVLQDLQRLSYGKDIVLLCYEKPEDICHRHYVAEWLGAEEIELC